MAATSPATAPASSAPVGSGQSSAPSASGGQSPSTAPSTTASQGSGTTIGKVLAAFPAGDITVDHAPTADPEWVTRVAAALARLCTLDCDAKQQAPLWAKTGVLDRLAATIEKAPMGEGTVMPSFLLFRTDDTFRSDDGAAFAKLYGAASPAAYFAAGGVWTSFQNGTGGQDLHHSWNGVREVQG